MPNIGPAPDRCSISASARPPVMVPEGRFCRVVSLVIGASPLGSVRRAAPHPPASRVPPSPRLRGEGRGEGLVVVRANLTTVFIQRERTTEGSDKFIRRSAFAKSKRRRAGVDPADDAVLIGRARVADAGARGGDR